jgi:hypothetical protein
MDKREYDQLSSLTNSSNEEISGLSLIVKNLKERLESLEKNQTSRLRRGYRNRLVHAEGAAFLVNPAANL